jgi:hypothetical protein
MDSAGVEVALNDGAPPELEVRADTVLVFGGDEVGPADFYRVRRPQGPAGPRGSRATPRRINASTSSTEYPASASTSRVC